MRIREICKMKPIVSYTNLYVHVFNHQLFLFTQSFRFKGLFAHFLGNASEEFLLNDKYHYIEPKNERRIDRLTFDLGEMSLSRVGLNAWFGRYIADGMCIEVTGDV